MVRLMQRRHEEKYIVLYCALPKGVQYITHLGLGSLTAAVEYCNSTVTTRQSVWSSMPPSSASLSLSVSVSPPTLRLLLLFDFQLALRAHPPHAQGRLNCLYEVRIVWYSGEQLGRR